MRADTLDKGIASVYIYTGIPIGITVCVHDLFSRICSGEDGLELGWFLRMGQDKL